MKKILAISGSNSKKSINFQLLKYASSFINEQSVQLVKLSDFPFPMYSVDVEETDGFKNSLIELKKDMDDADGIIFAINEHNWGLSAFFKNTLDWLSRLESNFLKSKPVLIICATPGRAGGSFALRSAADLLPRFGAEVTGTFAFPSFNHNFDTQKNSISNTELDIQLQEALTVFIDKV